MKSRLVLSWCVSRVALGTIPDVLSALRGMGRVLRPGGMLIFFELGLSTEPRVRRWQKQCDSIAYWLFEGLHLTRDIPSLLKQALRGREPGDEASRSFSEIVDARCVGHRDPAGLNG
jgi:sirohydrochlorin ferrochelatase